MDEKLIPGPVKGYKMVDENLCCRGVQFVVGEIVRHEGPLEMCRSGFHFCVHPSGVWAYYNKGRLFELEAYDVLDTPYEPGADLKKVCRGIRLVREIKVDGDGNTGNGNTGHRNTGDGNTGHSNTGDGNTGYSNTGYRNTGHRNTGHRNTGYRNTGHRNTGHRNTGNGNTGDGNTGNGNTGYGNTGYGNTGDGNTGYSNTGHRNTGYRNTGHRNTGHRNTGNGNTGYGNTGDENTGYRNTGHRNTGHRNTGNGNTGYGNTGDGNTCDRSSGHFNTHTPKLIIFDEPTSLEPDANLVFALSVALMSSEPFDPLPFLSLPNATARKIKKLHRLHIQRRQEQEV